MKKSMVHCLKRKLYYEINVDDKNKSYMIAQYVNITANYGKLNKHSVSGEEICSISVIFGREFLLNFHSFSICSSAFL